MGADLGRLLIVDDEPQIVRALTPALDAAGFTVSAADTGETALAQLAGEPSEVVILDLGLPDMDGKQALIRARAFYDGPILILSARDREVEKIEALDHGADDYLEKPFGVGELMARLRVAMRHRLHQIGAAPVIRAGDVEIDLVKRLVSRAGEPVKLSPREYDLLAKLAEGRGKVLTHRQLLTAVWGPANVEDVQYLRVFIGHLRQKLEVDPASPKLISTEAGVGYRFMSD